MRIAFFGTSGLVGSIRDARVLGGLVAAGLSPAIVVTTPDAPGGVYLPSAVSDAAVALGLPVLQPERLRGFGEELRKYDIDLSLVVAYGKILPSEVLSVARLGSLNLHPSLLPRWRGTTPIQSAILAGDSVTGVTIIQMDELADHGPIVVQKEFPLGGRAWTAPELADALADLGVSMFKVTLQPWAEGRIKPAPQDEAGATFTKMLKKEDGHIDWSRPAIEIERMVRAYQPWPGAYTFWQKGENRIRLELEAATFSNQQLTINRQQPTISNRGVGVVFVEKDDLSIQTEQGAVTVTRLKPSGSRSMPAADFLRGHSDIIGTVLS